MEYEFDLDNAIDSIDGVPEDLKHFYAKEGNGYKVAANMVGAAKRINGLTGNLKTERTKRGDVNRDAAKDRLAAKGYLELVGNIADLTEEQRTPEGLKAYLDGLAAKALAGGKKGDEAKAQLEAVKSEMAKAHAIALADKDKVIAEKDTALFRYMIGEHANSALTELKGNPLFLRPLIDRVARVKREDDGSYVVEVTDDKGATRYNGTGDRMTVKELVTEMSKDTKFGGAFEGRVASGSGTGPTNKTDKAKADKQNVGEGKDKGKNMIANGLRARQAARR